MIAAKRPLGSEDRAVIERISMDLQRDVLLAKALGQWRLASDIKATLDTTRRLIGGQDDVLRLETTAIGRVSGRKSLVNVSGESRAIESESLLASLLYLAGDIEAISSPAADLCRAAAELVGLAEKSADVDLSELEAG